MLSNFYKSIIEDEIQFFNIKQDTLKEAAKIVKKTYSPYALDNGKTFLDYNIPQHRCAYLYKYAAIHTCLVSKYFRNIMKKKQIKQNLYKKENIKICCLGGGPGTDIVGLFKAMSFTPNFHNKVFEVTVLDICGGWRNSFNRINENIIKGKAKMIPTAFIDGNTFKYKLITVNLVNELPNNVISILSEADIVCMVKFVSAILGSSLSLSALQNIGSKWKKDAIVLFIDNFRGKVFESLTDIAEQIGLQIVSGPSHKICIYEIDKSQIQVSSAEKKIYGCLPLNATRVTAIVFIKSEKSCVSDVQHTLVNETCHMQSRVENYNLDTINDTGDTVSKQTSQSLTKIACHKFTQTDIPFFGQDVHIGPETRSQLCLLSDSLSDLLNVLNLWQQKVEHLKTCGQCQC